jgi:hypothetical protein
MAGYPETAEEEVGADFLNSIMYEKVNLHILGIRLFIERT